MTARYTVTLTVDRPIRPETFDPGWTIESHLSWFTESIAKRELEREVLQALRKIDGDCDCEVMEAEIVSE